MYKNMFLMFFLFMHVFLETCIIKLVCLIHIAMLPSFIALLSCSILHWVNQTVLITITEQYYK